jgi:peptidoglycan/LPS O-acetylase OafA/YrhL
MAATRYIWMFRIAAVVFLALGLSWLWRFGLTDYRPDQRLYGLAMGLLAFLIGIFLFRRARAAIAISALSAVVVAVSAVLFVPNASGPGILFLIGLAVAGGLYAALSFRVLFAPGK